MWWQAVVKGGSHHVTVEVVAFLVNSNQAKHTISALVAESDTNTLLLENLNVATHLVVHGDSNRSTSSNNGGKRRRLTERREEGWWRSCNEPEKREVF